MSGFSDDVELGEIGEIKKNSSIVMRIQVEGDASAAETMHWRGVVLTNFDGRRWFTDEREIRTLTPGENGWFSLPQTEGETQRRTTRLLYSVLLEPIATNSLFYADEPTATRGGFTGQESAMSFRRSYLAVDATGSIFNPFHNYSRLSYEGLSLMPANTPADLRAASTDYPESFRGRYLQLPPLDPRIPALAQQITANLSSPFDKASAIAAYLRTHYSYTLDLSGTPPTADPLPYFLFTRRAGHCEYFASAMTVMVRSLGIPARYINGFLPGEYNDVGGDYVIRASDAHSWVEVYFPGYGWITFDPTPPSEEGPKNWSARLGEYWDWFQLTWSEWVINYDFAHQFQLAQDVERNVAHLDRAITRALGCGARRRGRANAECADAFAALASSRRARSRAVRGTCGSDFAWPRPKASPRGMADARRTRRVEPAPRHAALPENVAIARTPRPAQNSRANAARIRNVNRPQRNRRSRLATHGSLPGRALRQSWRANRADVPAPAFDPRRPPLPRQGRNLLLAKN